MRPIPAQRIGHTHGLLKALDQRGKLRLEEFVTEFAEADLFPEDAEGGAGRTRQLVSFAKAAGLVKEERGSVELTDLGKRYMKGADRANVFNVSGAQAEWLRRQLREKHLTESIWNGAAIGLSLYASLAPGEHVALIDFGRAAAHLGRAGWDNDNTFQSQGERFTVFLTDLELIDAERQLTSTGDETKNELRLPLHLGLLDLAAQLNPGGVEGAMAAAAAERGGSEAAAADPEPEAVDEPEAEEQAVEDEGEDEWVTSHIAAVPPPEAAEPEAAEPEAAAPEAEAPEAEAPEAEAPGVDAGVAAAAEEPGPEELPAAEEAPEEPPAAEEAPEEPAAAEEAPEEPPAAEEAPEEPPAAEEAADEPPAAEEAPEEPPAAQEAPEEPAAAEEAPEEPPAAEEAPEEPPAAEGPPEEPPAAEEASEEPPAAEEAEAPAGDDEAETSQDAGAEAPVEEAAGEAPAEIGPIEAAALAAAQAGDEQSEEEGAAMTDDDTTPEQQPTGAPGAPPPSSSDAAETPSAPTPSAQTSPAQSAPPPPPPAPPSPPAPPPAPADESAPPPPSSPPSADDPATTGAAEASTMPYAAIRPTSAITALRPEDLAAWKAEQEAAGGKEGAATQAKGKKSSGSFLDPEQVKTAAENRGLVIDEGVYAAAIAALASGRHLVLTGGAGSGKTALALAIAEAAVRQGRCKSILFTSAGSGLNTGETLGRRYHDGGKDDFTPGLVPKSISNDQWLVIDELERVKLDRALGRVSTVLGGHPMDLPGGGELKPPESWRVLATMSDISGVASTSPALRRRFVFIEVPALERPDLEKLVDTWSDGDEVAKAVGLRLIAINDVTPLGPGLYRDAIMYVKARRRLAPADETHLTLEALAGFVLPQLEGLGDEVAAGAVAAAGLGG